MAVSGGEIVFDGVGEVFLGCADGFPDGDGGDGENDEETNKSNCEGEATGNEDFAGDFLVAEEIEGKAASENADGEDAHYRDEVADSAK